MPQTCERVCFVHPFVSALRSFVLDNRQTRTGSGLGLASSALCRTSTTLHGARTRNLGCGSPIPKWEEHSLRGSSLRLGLATPSATAMDFPSIGHQERISRLKSNSETHTVGEVSTTCHGCSSIRSVDSSSRPKREDQLRSRGRRRKTVHHNIRLDYRR